MARSHGAARSFLIGGGVIYLLLWLYGLFVDHASQANFVPLNDADDWLTSCWASAWSASA